MSKQEQIEQIEALLQQCDKATVEAVYVVVDRLVSKEKTAQGAKVLSLLAEFI